MANLQHCGYAIIHRAAKDMGWRVAERGESWDFGWSDNNQLLREMSKMFSHPRTLQPVQRINHLPNNKHLYRKDTLANNMMYLRAELPEAFCALPCARLRSVSSIVLATYWQPGTQLPPPVPALRSHRARASRDRLCPRVLDASGPYSACATSVSLLLWWLLRSGAHNERARSAIGRRWKLH